MKILYFLGRWKEKEGFKDVYCAIKQRNASLYVNNINLRPMLGTGYTLEIIAWTLS